MTFNTNAPNGLLPVKYLSGAPFNDATNPYNIASGYATSIFWNDPVTIGTDGNLAIGVAGSAIIGVFQGCLYTSTSGVVTFSPYWPASTVTQNSAVVLAKVVDNPEVVFSIQETNASNLAGTPLTAAAVGQNFNFLVGAGVTASGQSTTSLNNASGNPGSDTTLNLKVLGLDQTIGNTYGSFANWLVLINNHQYKGGTGTVGHS